MLHLQLLNQFEQEPNRLVLSFHTQFHVAAVVLDDFYKAEIVAEALNHAEQGALGKDLVRNFVAGVLPLEDCLRCFLRVTDFFVVVLFAKLQNRLDD